MGLRFAVAASPLQQLLHDLDFIVNADGSITIRPGEEPASPPVTPPDVQPEIPDLGDSLLILFLLLMAFGAGMVAFASRRRREYMF